MRMIFMGRKKYAAEMLKWTIAQGIEVRFVCTDVQNTNSSIIKVTKENNIPIITMEEAEEYVQTHKEDIDIVVSYLYWRKIRKPLIDIPKYGCINFHPAILLDWRGCAGYNIAILKKLSEWGATAHYVDESIDTGAIIKVYKFNFDWRIETAYSLEKKTQNIQMELYKSVIWDVLEKGKLDCTKREIGMGTYISKKEMIEMMKIDLEKLEEINLDLMIKAFGFPTYDGAGFEVNGRFYTLINREILETLKESENYWP